MEFFDITVDALRTCVGLTAAAYALSAVGLNLQFGYTGLLNLGHVGSMMLGAYGTAISVDRGLPLGAGVIIGVAAAVAIGLVIGVFTLRLRAEYLAILTISFVEMLRFTIRSSWADPITNSVFGIQRFADAFFDINPIPAGQYGIGDFNFTDRNLWLMAVTWPTVIIVAYLISRLLKSPWGRVLKSIREDEDVSKSLGKNVFLYKVQSLTIGSALGALGGIALAIEQQNVHPNFFIPIITFYIYVIVIMGGTSSIWGSVLGSIAFWFAFDWLDGLARIAIGREWFGGLLQSTEIGRAHV